MCFKSTLKIGSISNYWHFQDLGGQNEQMILLGILGGTHCRVLRESSPMLIQHHHVFFFGLLYSLSLCKVFLSSLIVSYMDMGFHHIWSTQLCIHPTIIWESLQKVRNTLQPPYSEALYKTSVYCYNTRSFMSFDH